MNDRYETSRHRRAVGRAGKGIAGVLTASALLASAIAFAPHTSAAGGGTATATSPLGTVTLTAGNVTFDGSTATIPLHLTYEKNHHADWTKTTITVRDMAARQVGSRAVLGFQTNWVYWGEGSARKGTGTAILPINSFDFVPGQPLLIYGTAVFEDFATADNKKYGVAFSPVISVNVAQEATTLRDVGVIDNRVTGRATVESSVGTTGADGFVTVRYQRPGANKWIRVDDYLNCVADQCQFVDIRGEFDLLPAKRIPLGSKVEVSIRDCGWCTDTTTTVRAN